MPKPDPWIYDWGPNIITAVVLVLIGVLIWRALREDDGGDK
jgi:hypothetical protein